MIDYLKYLNASEADKNWGLYLKVIGRSTTQSGKIYPPESHPSAYSFKWENGRRLDEFQLNYIVEGSGVFETETETFKVGQGDLMVIFPEAYHRYKPLEETGWTERYVGFDGSLAHHFISLTDLNEQNPIINCGIDTEIIRVYDKIQDLTIQQRPGYHQVISGLILELIGRVTAQHKIIAFKGRERETEQMILHAKKYMWENITQPIDMKLMANKYHISYSNFRKTFKSYTGQPPNQYLIDLKILKAKELISTSDKSIKEICFMLGFDSLQYFSRLFKQKTGSNPSTLRNANP